MPGAARRTGTVTESRAGPGGGRPAPRDAASRARESWTRPSVDQRGGPADRDDLDALARLDDAVLVEGARRPDLVLDAGVSDVLVVGDALEHDGRAPDQRGGPGPDL